MVEKKRFVNFLLFSNFVIIFNTRFYLIFARRRNYIIKFTFVTIEDILDYKTFEYYIKKNEKKIIKIILKFEIYIC